MGDITKFFERFDLEKALQMWEHKQKVPLNVMLQDLEAVHQQIGMHIVQRVGVYMRDFLQKNKIDEETGDINMNKDEHIQYLKNVKTLAEMFKQFSRVLDHRHTLRFDNEGLKAYLIGIDYLVLTDAEEKRLDDYFTDAAKKNGFKRDMYA